MDIDSMYSCTVRYDHMCMFDGRARHLADFTFLKSKLLSPFVPLTLLFKFQFMIYVLSPPPLPIRALVNSVSSPRSSQAIFASRPPIAAISPLSFPLHSSLPLLL